MTRRGYICGALITTALVLSFLSVSSSALAAGKVSSVRFGQPPLRAQFSLKATEGYSVFVRGFDRRVSVTVEDHKGSAIYRGSAIYSVRGRASTRGIRASLGSFGRIAVTFNPTGQEHRSAPPKRCKGGDEVTREGIFVGTIRFTGEDGYTRLNAHRATGRTMLSPPWRCEPRHGSGEFDALPFELPVLASFTPDQRVAFAAIDSEEPDGLGLAFYSGGTIERRGSVKIERVVFVAERASTFSPESDFSAATVRPPRPFRGMASFVRNPDGSTSWTGPLSVSLPGAGTVELTGPSFTANLTKPKTLSEYLDIFGVFHRANGLNLGR